MKSFKQIIENLQEDSSEKQAFELLDKWFKSHRVTDWGSKGFLVDKLSSSLKCSKKEAEKYFADWGKAHDVKEEEENLSEGKQEEVALRMILQIKKDAEKANELLQKVERQLEMFGKDNMIKMLKKTKSDDHDRIRTLYMNVEKAVYNSDLDLDQIISDLKEVK